MLLLLQIIAVLVLQLGFEFTVGADFNSATDNISGSGIKGGHNGYAAKFLGCLRVSVNANVEL